MHAPWRWRRGIRRDWAVLERIGDHVIRLCIDHHVPGAGHRLQSLLDLKTGWTLFLYDHQRARARGGDCFQMKL